MKYNYVFFNSPGSNTRKTNPNEYFYIAASELKEMKNVRVISYPLDYAPYAIRFLFDFHRSPKTNKIFPLPFKSLWFPHYFKNEFEQERPLCFVVQGRYITKYYLKYLKQKYPNAKYVKIYRDLIEKSRHHIYDRELLESFFDLCMTYDENDAIKYGMLHFNEIGSKTPVRMDKNYPLSDVFFAGAAKDRLDILLKSYSVFTEAGLRCMYYLTGVPEKERQPLEGVTYANRQMLYSDMLYKTVNSRCILEINQKGATGFTSRFLEAVMYNKKLITNNPAVKETKFYDSKLIQFFERPEEINTSFVMRDIGEIDYHYQGEYSPIRLIEKIEKNLP